MPWNLLLLPLLGGYVFVSRCDLYRYYIRRQSSYRLLFSSALAAIPLLLLAYLLAILCSGTFLAELWARHIAFPYSGTSFLAFLIGFVAWWPVNKIVLWMAKRDKRFNPLHSAIKKKNDSLELLLFRAITASKLVSVTLRSGKVYIGLVTSTIEPGEDRHFIQILPFFSGYRDNTQQMVIVTEYSSVLRDAQDGKFNMNVSDFYIVLPVDLIQSANIFDPEAYAAFHEGTPEQETPPSGTDA